MSEEVPEILSAYLDGELSPAEMVRVEQELESNPALQAQLAVLRKYQWQIQALPLITPPVNFLDKISLQFEQTVPESNTTHAVTPLLKPKAELAQTTTLKSAGKAKLILSRWAGICTSVCAMVMVVGFSYWSLNSSKSNRDMDFTYNKMSRLEAIATGSSERNDFDDRAVPPPTAGAAVMADSIPVDSTTQVSNAPFNQTGLLAPNYVVTWENEHAIYLSDAPRDNQQSIQNDKQGVGEKQPGDDISDAYSALAYNELNLTQIGNRGITVSNNEYALRFVMSDEAAVETSAANKKGDDQSAQNTPSEKQDLSVDAKDSQTGKNNMPAQRNSYGSSKEPPALPAEQNMAIAQDATQSQNTHSPQTYFNTLINVEAPEDHILVLKVNLDGDAAQLQELEQILTRNNIISTADGLVSKSATAQNQKSGDNVPNATTFAASESQTNAEPQKSINELPKSKIEKSAENLTAQALSETGKAGELNQTILASQGVYLDATTVQLEQTFNELLAHKTVREMEVSLAYVPTDIPLLQENLPSPSVRVEPRSARTMSTEDDTESMNKNYPADKEYQHQKARVAEEANSKVAPKTNPGRNGNKELKSKQNVEDQPATFNNQDRKPGQQAKTGVANQTRVDVFRGQANNRGSTQATPQHSVDESKNAPFIENNQTMQQPRTVTNITGLSAPQPVTERQGSDKKQMEEELMAKPTAEHKSDQQRHQVYPQTPSKQTQIGQNINGRKVLIFFERRAPITGNQRHIPPAPAVPEK